MEVLDSVVQLTVKYEYMMKNENELNQKVPKLSNCFSISINENREYLFRQNQR